MSTNEKHTEKIKCPDCGTIQDATVEHTVPFHTYLHICTKCDFTIMESEWQVVSTNEKQLTAVQMLREKLIERKNATLELIKTLGNKDMPTQIEDGLLAAYCDIINDIDTELLATERQQLIDAHIAGQKFASDNHNPDSEEYYNQTFKQ